MEFRNFDWSHCRAAFRLFCSITLKAFFRHGRRDNLRVFFENSSFGLSPTVWAIKISSSFNAVKNIKSAWVESPIGIVFSETHIGAFDKAQYWWRPTQSIDKYIFKVRGPVRICMINCWRFRLFTYVISEKFKKKRCFETRLAHCVLFWLQRAVFIPELVGARRRTSSTGFEYDEMLN